MKIEFNIKTVMSGLKGIVFVFGIFDSKKAVVKLLDCSMYYFNGTANFGALGNVGEIIAALHPPNTLLAMEEGIIWRGGRDLDTGKVVIPGPIKYWVHKGGDEWEEKTYTPPEEADSK